VFERFFKADRGRGAVWHRTGAGVVKHIVLAHGSTVTLKARPGRATFAMLLPRQCSHAAAA
jgi:signal transduction histidine kinase